MGTATSSCIFCMTVYSGGRGGGERTRNVGGYVTHRATLDLVVIVTIIVGGFVVVSLVVSLSSAALLLLLGVSLCVLGCCARSSALDIWRLRSYRGLGEVMVRGWPLLVFEGGGRGCCLGMAAGWRMWAVVVVGGKELTWQRQP